MKLYYAPGACSLADHIALIEGELPYEIEKVDLRAKTTETGSDFLAINPKGYVPALEIDGDGVLTENIAILAFIADKAGALLPTGELGRFRALEATAFIATELHKNFHPFFNPAASEAERDEAKGMLAKRFAILEAQLGDQLFLFGEAITVADCYLFVMLHWAAARGVAAGDALEAYHARIRQRPAVVRAFAEEGLD